MPYKRSRRSRTRRPVRKSRRTRRYRKRDADQTRGRFKPRFLGTTKNGITPAFQTKLTYSQDYNVSTDGFGIYWQQYRLNGCNDPDYGLGGHSVYMWDQLTPLYNRYVVTGCKVEVVGRWRTNNIDTNPIVGNIILTAGNVGLILPSSPADAREKQLGFVHTQADTRVYKISRYYDIAQVLGVPKSRVRNDDVFSSLVSADPTSSTQAIIHIGFVNQNPAVVTNWQGQVTMTYYVKMFDPKQFAQS